MERILITGIPGTGKTTLGDHLAQQHSYVHMDMENDGTRERFRRDRSAFLTNLPEKVVITWGFHPQHDVGDILFLKESGFQLVWFAGNRPAGQVPKMLSNGIGDGSLGVGQAAQVSMRLRG